MKTVTLAIGLLMFVSAIGGAFDRSRNPDRFMSVGLDVSSGKLPGILTDQSVGDPHTDGGFVKGLLDVRLPVSNAITFHAFGSSTGVNNNMQFSQGNEVGIGLRVYLQD